MQGPFSQAFNEMLWREWRVDCVITKDSGSAGGYEAKVQAAKSLEIPVLLVKRPISQYRPAASDLAGVLQCLMPIGARK